MFFEVALLIIVVASTDMIIEHNIIVNSSVIDSIAVAIIGGCGDDGATEVRFSLQ